MTNVNDWEQAYVNKCGDSWFFKYGFLRPDYLDVHQ